MLFVVGAAVSLGASWLLVSRIERMGNRVGVTEAMLGLLAALAADAPEITSAISALAGNRQDIGEGVVLGSNVFNLAALIGLGAVVAGFVALHRRAVVLAGGVSLWVAAACLLTVTGAAPPLAGLMLVLLVLVPYVVLAADRRDRPERSPVRRWLARAMTEEEQEIHVALVPGAWHWDLMVIVGSLATVIGASVVMERAGAELGTNVGLSGIMVGGVLLAAVTSLPNAVAAVYLARRGRGTAMLSTALEQQRPERGRGPAAPGGRPRRGPTLGRRSAGGVLVRGAHRPRPGLRVSRPAAYDAASACWSWRPTCSSCSP